MAARTVEPSLKDVAEQVRKTSKEKVPAHQDYKKATIPTGLTTLNMALDDNPHYGYRAGSVINIIGDTHTGKTMLAFLCLAACAHDRSLKEYELIHDDAEAAMAFDVSKLFGKKTQRRVRPMHPGRKPPYSRTVEDFLFGIMEMLDAGIPFIAIEDSLDALSSEADLKYVEVSRKAWKKGDSRDGTYGTGKAKGMSELFRTVVDRIEQSDSLLIIISQTRDNINPMSFKKKTRSGGKALDFYASIIMWLAHLQKLTKTVRKKKYSIGNATKISVDKNKYTGKQRTAAFDTFYDYGVDDIGSMVDWMLEHELWKSGKEINARGLGLSGSRAALIKQIEDEGLEPALQELIHGHWQDIEQSLRLDRKRRF